MSPPKVTLAGKEPLKSVSEEVPQEKTDLPAVITMNDACPRPPHHHDRHHPHHDPHHCRRHRQKRCRLIICGVAIVIIMVVAALGTLALVHRFKRHHRKNWECRYGKGQLPEHVEVDHENQLIYAKHDHDDMSNTAAMEILHEYDRGLIAYKDVDNNMCYIDRLDETFIEGYERWESYEKDDHKDRKPLQVISKPIEVEVIKHIGDIHITAHCENAESVWVQEIEETSITEEMVVVYV